MQRYAKVRSNLANKNTCRAPSDTYLKLVLGGDQDLVFTFSNPALISAPLMDGPLKIYIVQFCKASVKDYNP